MYMRKSYQTTCSAVTVMRQPICDAIYSEVAVHRVLLQTEI
jgi:hypothetical protein